MTTKSEWHSHIKPVGVFDSKFEKGIFDQLKAAGVDVIRSPGPIWYGRPDERKRYLPDFLVKTRDGRRVFIEAKGWLNTQAAEKMRYVKGWNPELDIRLVFQNGSGKVGRLQSNNLQWSKRNKYPASEINIPDEWVTEFMKDS